jgi:hypothetical protein
MKNLTKYTEFLALKKPVCIRVITKMNEWVDALYMPVYSGKGKLREHKITIYYNGNSRDFDTLLAHELIHAKQEEKQLKEIHGRFFRKTARKMQKRFKLERIYIKGLDV